MSKMHFRDIRLFSNAGMAFPVCKANAKLLDTETRLTVTSDKTKVTCKNCVKAHNANYSWADKLY